MPVAGWKRMSALALMVSALVGACGDDDNADDKGQTSVDAGLDSSVQTDGSALPPPSGDSGAPIDLSDAGIDGGTPEASGPIVLQWQFYTSDSDFFNYLNVFPDLDKSRAVDPKQGTEIRDNGDAQVYKGVLYWAKREIGTITRYERDASGAMVAGATVNFSALGITDATDFIIVSETKGYLFDSEGLKLIKFNPSTMTIVEGTTDISMLARDGFTHYIMSNSFEAHVRGSRLYVPVAWVANRAYKQSSGVLVIDTNSDQVVRMNEDERCAGVYNTVEAPNGDIYLLQSLTSATLQLLTQQKPSCALRILAGQDTLDPTFNLNLSALVGNRAVQGGIPDGKGGFYVKVFYAERVSSTDPADLYDASGNSNWRHWHINPVTNTATEITVTPFDSSSVRYYDLGDGRIYTPVAEYDEKSEKYKTTYFEIGQDVQPTQRISVNGWSETVGIVK